MKYTLDYNRYTEVARKAVAEGQVLLENRKNVLPIKEGSTVAVFGRIQLNYYKSGTGSGGMVNVSKVTGILDALLEAEEDGSVKVYRPLLQKYRDFVEENPFDEGVGWANEPWSQKEMELDDATVKDAADSADYAIVVIGRSAGEDRDTVSGPGAYRLSETESDMLRKVRDHFDKVIVILNVGNTIDMNFVNEYNVDAVLYAWQGGMIGGLGTVDVLTGKVNPSGKLPDTLAKSLEDYPSHDNFGDPDEAVYAEDIYVGYRYFETFNKDAVLYPFGFGLSYTDFSIDSESILKTDKGVSLGVTVTNVGLVPGKEVVQIYVEAPCGKLGKPKRVLVAYEKTDVLDPAASKTIHFDILNRDFSSYDDNDTLGLGTGFVLEKGEYIFYAGSDVRSAKKAGSVVFEEDLMIEPLKSALRPVKAFKRMKAVDNGDGSFGIEHEDTPLRTDTQKSRRDANIPKALPITGDKGYRLKDVKDGKVSMDDFIAQFSEEELCTIIRGEGMGSSQVTAGTASAFGGISPALKGYGLPAGCMDDGPSGMRLDSGMLAFSLPSGTLLASTFNKELVGELFSILGIEMLKNKVDVLLGPGMNIHRYPLNGRNFEYFSEDPYLTGTMGSAQFKALKERHVSGTLKHFACNNQETGRQQVDPVVSERALREIYLRGYEIAVKEGADAMMTTYCRLNGVWTSGNYDLNTTVLREQWGFKGIVMTDWWANISEEGSGPDKVNFAAMVRAQNDLYMCVPGALDDIGDNARSSIKDGSLSIGELQRTARNVCGFLLDSACFIRMNEDIDIEITGDDSGLSEAPMEVTYIKIERDKAIDLSHVKVKRGEDYYFGIDFESDLGNYDITLVAKGEGDNELAQIPVTLFMHTMACCGYTFRGNGEWMEETHDVKFLNRMNIMHLHFGQDGLILKELRFKHTEKIM